MRWALLLFPLVLTACDPMGTAHVNIASSDAVSATATELQTALDEYHHRLGVLGKQQRNAAVGDFVGQVVAANGDKAATTKVTNGFMGALDALDADAEVERQRYSASSDNVSLLFGLSKRLNQFGVDSMTAADEYRRYIGSMWDDVQKARADKAKDKAASDATKQQQKDSLGKALTNAAQQALSRKAQP